MHGIFTCKHCAMIMELLAMRETFSYGLNGIRSNQLLKLVKETIDPKIAAPTLYRHLRYLQKGKIIKRLKKGKQNVTYLLDSDSPLLSKEDLEFPKKWLASNEKRVRSLNLKEIIDCVLILTRLHALELTKIQLEKDFSGERLELIRFKELMMNSFYRGFFIILFNAMLEKGAEYNDVMNLLEKEITDMKREFFETNSLQ